MISISLDAWENKLWYGLLEKKTLQFSLFELVEMFQVYNFQMEKKHEHFVVLLFPR